MKKLGILSVILCVALLTACGGGTSDKMHASISEAGAIENTTDEAYMTTTETTTEATAEEAE